MENKTVRYRCYGSVRGLCGTDHRTLSAACACTRRDRAACASLGGGAYSDRWPEPIGREATTEEADAAADLILGEA